jgi:hypothetical protein
MQRKNTKGIRGGKMQITIKTKEQFINEIQKIEIKEFMCGDIEFLVEAYILTMSFECYGLRRSSREDISNCQTCVRGDECLKKKNCDFYLNFSLKKSDSKDTLAFHIYRNIRGVKPKQIENTVFLSKIFKLTMAKILEEKIVNNETV